MLNVLDVLNLLNVLEMPEDPSLACWALFVILLYKRSTPSVGWLVRPLVRNIFIKLDAIAMFTDSE